MSGERGVDATRLETLIVARLSAQAEALDIETLAKQLIRYAPAKLQHAAWRDAIEGGTRALRTRQVLRDDGRLHDDGELARRIGKVPARTWTAMTDRVLPGLALGIGPDDAKSHKRLVGRDAWAAAIAARALGLWREGPPPSPSAVCDAFVWRQLGLGGKAKRVPPEIRALFIQRELATDPAAPDRLLRLFAARAVGAPRADLRALRDALVQRWLCGEELGARGDAGDSRAASEPPDGEAFVPAVRAIASGARDGVFGDRKVFISSAWEAMRDRAGWSDVSLDEFKAQLVQAHRRGELVLARADLVAAMDPALVAASETRTDGASFHFIVREAS